MFNKYIKYLIVIFFLIFSTDVSALDYSKLPKIIKTNIEKQYSGQKIKVISAEKIDAGFMIIVQTTTEKEKIVVDKNDKIISTSLVDEDSLIQNVIKPSIIKYFKTKKIQFLFFKKMDNGNYFVIIKLANMQDQVTLDKTGKILSITEDLNALEEVEEGC